MISRSVIDVSYLRKNAEWEVVSSSATSFNTSKEGMSHSGISFDVTIKRIPDFYIMNIVLPTMLMSGTSLLVFLSPSRAEEKTVLAVTVFLSFTVYSTVVVDNVPKAGRTPLLCTLLQMIIILKHALYIFAVHYAHLQCTIHIYSVLHIFKVHYTYLQCTIGIQIYNALCIFAVHYTYLLCAINIPSALCIFTVHYTYLQCAIHICNALHIFAVHYAYL